MKRIDMFKVEIKCSVSMVSSDHPGEGEAHAGAMDANLFFTLREPIWVGDLETEPKNKFFII
jgi:hypothetical protein